MKQLSTNALIFVFLVTLSALATEPFRLEVVPYDFQEDTGYDVQYLGKMNNIYIRGDELYAFDPHDPRIVRLNLPSREGHLIGRQGRGPGELVRGVHAVGSYQRDMWVIDSGKKNRLMHFRDDRCHNSFEIDIFPSISSVCARRLGCSDKQVVVPAMPSTGYLAIAYDQDGKRRAGMGEPLFYEKDRELIRRVPMINLTSWLYHKDHWYGVFLYYPLVVKFDASLKKVTEFDLTHPLLVEKIESILDFHPKKVGSHSPPLVYDFTIFDDHLYILAYQYLFRLALETGEIRSVSRFAGSAEHFGEPKAIMVFDQLAFHQDGTLYLSNQSAMDLWGHDMFYVKNLPFLNP